MFSLFLCISFLKIMNCKWSKELDLRKAADHSFSFNRSIEKHLACYSLHELENLTLRKFTNVDFLCLIWIMLTLTKDYLNFLISFIAELMNWLASILIKVFLFKYYIFFYYSVEQAWTFLSLSCQTSLSCIKVKRS